ncbi:MAG: OmpP1/FadL family transporter [Desulfomonilia bacterium]
MSAEKARRGDCREWRDDREVKVQLFMAGFLAFLFLLPVQGSAQIYNQTCQSAEYARMVNRNAAADAADITVYNPAGLVDLADGYHLNVSNQIWIRRPTHTFTDPLGTGELSYEQEGVDWIIPNLHAAYTHGDWAIFGAGYIPGGGAALDYPDGSFSTRALGAGVIGPDGPAYIAYKDITDEFIEGSSLYIAYSIGGAYRISDRLSIAAGIRTITVRNTIEGGLTLAEGWLGPLTPDMPLRVDVRETGQGWGGVFGIQVRPSEKLNIALHYESRVRLDLETEIRSGDNVSEDAGLFRDGEKVRRDFPDMVGLGASYQFTPEFRAEVNFNYWFQEASDWGRSPDGKNISDLAGDSWSIGAAMAYQVLPKAEISSGFLYTIYDWNDLDAYYNANLGAIEVYYADDVMFGLGFGYELIPGLIVNFGTGYILYVGETVQTLVGDVDIENTSSAAFVLGIDYSF